MFTFNMTTSPSTGAGNGLGKTDDQLATASATSERRGAFARATPAAVLLLAMMSSAPVSAVIRGCVDPCPPPVCVFGAPPGSQGCQDGAPGAWFAGGRGAEIQFRRASGSGSVMEQRYLDSRASHLPAGATQGESLFASLSGDWDVVTGYVTFPYSADGITVDQLLLRGLPAQRIDETEDYEVPGWTRSAYWFDVDNGVPRLLSTELIDRNYVPQADEPFEDSGHLNYVPLVMYREEGRNYSDFPDGAALGSIFFVSDPLSGEVLDAVINLYGANGEYEKTEYLYEGDELKPLLITYRLTEPEFVYYAEYGDFINLSDEVSLGLANHVPGVDFVDPDLVDFDAANAPLELLLEGYRDEPVGGVNWAYSEIYPLGYTWGLAQEYLFGSGFEEQQTAANPTAARGLLRTRNPK